MTKNDCCNTFIIRLRITNYQTKNNIFQLEFFSIAEKIKI